MQSALPKRWRGLKTVKTALLGGRGPIASFALNFAREYERPREPRWATADLLFRICPALFRAGGMRRRNNAESAIKSPPTIMRPWRRLTPRVRGVQG